MQVFHDVGSDDCMKIRFHEIEDKVDIFVALCFDDIEEGDYVRVSVELLKENDLNDISFTSLQVRWASVAF